MFDRLEAIENRFEELNMRLADPEVINDQSQYLKLMKEHSELSTIVEKYREYKNHQKNLEDARLMLREKPDPELKEMIELEIEDAQNGMEKAELELKVLLMPKDPNDDRDVIMEIRGGAGGDEAALFAAVLFRMYSHYAESKGWIVNIIDSNPTEIGGFKEIVFEIEGKGAYSRLKFESGVHRVQRVPTTESSGRIHTSTVQWRFAEVDDVDNVEINPADIGVEPTGASGAGGQHINKTSSAIRITHIPSGIVVLSGSALTAKNRDKAMRVLNPSSMKSSQKQSSEVAETVNPRWDRGPERADQNLQLPAKTCNRSSDRLHNLPDRRFLNGDIEELIDKLITTIRPSSAVRMRIEEKEFL
jgi:peptide chain release factor 1